MEDFRAASLKSWTAVAPDWDELTAWVDYQLGIAAEWMLEEASPGRGDRVLELAAGPGTLSLGAARAVGAEGQVICTDFAEAMVDTARRRLAAEGAENVECRVVDAEAIDLPDGAVEVVLCRMGYMLMADPAAALRETARVLAPGGRAALTVWSDAISNPWAALPMQTIMAQLGAPPPEPGAPGLWALADRTRLQRLLEDAGLESVHIQQLDDVVEYESFEHWFELTGRLAGPIRALLAGLNEKDRRTIEARLREAAQPYHQADERLSMPERMLGASARRA
ncbi:MAG: methyltransferase domain-containing protein [Actinobacteria bacterium]|nr:MAG: methyltransferase domain-containing protein [Actinomycetota bacterium]